MIISQNSSSCRHRNLVEPSSGKEREKEEREGEERRREIDGFIRRRFCCTVTEVVPCSCHSLVVALFHTYSHSGTWYEGLACISVLWKKKKNNQTARW